MSFYHHLVLNKVLWLDNVFRHKYTGARATGRHVLLRDAQWLVQSADSPHIGTVARKAFPWHDAIMGNKWNKDH